MRLENSGIQNTTADLNHLDHLLPNMVSPSRTMGLRKSEYDRKFELREGVYYLRMLGYATEGDVGAHKATIKFLVPLLGKHYYPHGVEYGDGEYFPVPLVKECEKILANVKKELDEFNGL